MPRTRRSSPSGARLIDSGRSKAPLGIVVVIHGGAQRAEPTAVRRTQPSVIRMVPLARAIARAGRGRLAVHRLLNARRGWDLDHPPTDDIAWALGALQETYDDLPVVLVGHSLGGRAALLAGATGSSVLGVVALNPWVYPTDDSPLEGRSVLIVHGDADRIAPLAQSRDVARRLARRTDVELEVVAGGKHAMLSRSDVYERHTTGFVTRVLLGDLD